MTANGEKELPLVVLLDLDGTLVGKVGSILCEYEIGRWLASLGKEGARRATSSGRAAAGVSKALRDSIVRRMCWGIIRPHVHEFCRSLPPGVELFVYTASDDGWANFVVPCVEAALNVKFNRPIFARSSCVRVGGENGDLRKSVRSLLPAIARALGGRPRPRGGAAAAAAAAAAHAAATRRWYPALRSAADLRDRVILVDNTANVMADAAENARVVLCPTYSYSYGYDVLAHVPVDLAHKGFRQLAPILERAGLYPEPALLAARHPQQQVDSFQRFASIYYRRLAKSLEVSLAGNAHALSSDTFFLRLLHAIAALGRRGAVFSDANVASISRSISFRDISLISLRDGGKPPPEKK